MRIDGIAAYLHSAGRMSREWRTVVVHATSCARTSLSPVCTHSNTVYSSSSLCCTSAPSVCASGLLSAATHTISANDLRSADAANSIDSYLRSAADTTRAAASRTAACANCSSYFCGGRDVPSTTSSADSGSFNLLLSPRATNYSAKSEHAFTIYRTASPAATCNSAALASIAQPLRDRTHNQPTRGFQLFCRY